MRLLQLFVTGLILVAGFVHPEAFSQDKGSTCRNAFVYKSYEFTVTDTIKICSDTEKIPIGYESQINMPVCDDKLCANVILMFYWDLAGNYVRFDTLPGKPLTKFDHKRFSDADYKKLDQILKNKNSMLRILEKEDLIDKTVKVKATTVDAVTGATPKIIKNAVVEGAVYSSYTLWYFVNGTLKNELEAYTRSIYSDHIFAQLVISDNYETQLFALRQMSAPDFERHSDLIFQVIRRSSPLIKAYIIGKLPLPFQNEEKNKTFISLFSELDDYSKSTFLNRITGEKNLILGLLPMMSSQVKNLDDKQLDFILSSWRKYNIPGYSELIEKLHLKQKL